MAQVNEIINRIRMQATSEGIDKANRDLKEMAANHAALGQATETSAAKQLSMVNKLQQHENRLDGVIRANRQYEKTLREMNLLIQQQPQYTERATHVIALAADQLQKQTIQLNAASAATGVFAQTMQSVQGSAQGMASSLGTMGTILSRFGPMGIAIAAGLYVGTRAIGGLVQSVNDLADRSGKMVDFAETTGISTTALTGLSKAGAEVGVSSEKIITGIERFTVQMDEARRSTGQLHETMERIDPALAKQMVTARDTAEAWDILAETYRKADMSQRNVLARAAFGRTGIGMGRLLNVSAESGGIAALTESMAGLNIVTDQERKKLDEIKDRVDFLAKTSEDLFAAFFAPEVLRAQELYYTALLAIGNQLRDIQQLREKAPGMGSQWTLGRLRPGELEGAGVSPEPAAPAAPGMSVEAQNALAAAADKVVQSVLPEIEATKKLQKAIDAMTAAADANVQSRMKQADVSGRVLEALLNEQSGLQALQQQYPNLSLAVAQRVQALQMQAQAADAVTVAEKEMVANAQLQIQLSQQKLTLAEQEAILDAARIARAAQLNATIQAAALGSAQSMQFSNAQMQMEIGLLNQSGIAANRIKAEWAALAPIRLAALAAGKSEAEINAILAEQKGLLGGLIETNAQLLQAREDAAQAAIDAEKAVQEELERTAKKKQEMAEFERSMVDTEWSQEAMARRTQQSQDDMTRATEQGTERRAEVEQEAAAESLRMWERYWAARRAEFDAAYRYIFTVEGQVMGKRPGTGETNYRFIDDMTRYLWEQVAEGLLEYDPSQSHWQDPYSGFVETEKAIQGRYDAEQKGYEDLIKTKGATGALDELISGMGRVGEYSGRVDEKSEANRLATINRLMDLLPEEGQIPQVEKMLAKVREQPVTLAREELIKQLTDKIEQLKNSTDALNDTIEIDPLYTQGHGYIGIGYYTEGGRSSRIPLDPNTPAYVPDLPTKTPVLPPPTTPIGPNPGWGQPSGFQLSPLTEEQLKYRAAHPGTPINFATGGSFTVGGSGGTDSQYFPMALTPGEMIDVTPPGEASRKGKPIVVNNITNNFNFPPDRSYGSRRTQRQAREGYGRSMAVMH